jgi:hypothetical protein
MKSKLLHCPKNYLLKSVLMSLLVLFILLGASLSVNAQKYEITGNQSALTRATEITLSSSTINKFYYLFRLDENGAYQYVTFMVGQGIPLNYAPQKTAGKYVIIEFDEFKEKPFNFEKFKPTDGILQTGEITITPIVN